MKRILKAFWSDERGQSTTEYILILSVVVMVALKFKKTFEGQLDGMIGKLGGKLNEAIDSE